MHETIFIVSKSCRDGNFTTSAIIINELAEADEKIELIVLRIVGFILLDQGAREII